MMFLTRTSGVARVSGIRARCVNGAFNFKKNPDKQDKGHAVSKSTPKRPEKALRAKKVLVLFYLFKKISLRSIFFGGRRLSLLPLLRRCFWHISVCDRCLDLDWFGLTCVFCSHFNNALYWADSLAGPQIVIWKLIKQWCTYFFGHRTTNNFFQDGGGLRTSDKIKMKFFY